ncbi:MAG: EAL domain-containing protein [Xanthomonadaceae bacterium]|nr:EAL domain-containing protein [Xanthomonadaceae bacterium]
MFTPDANSSTHNPFDNLHEMDDLSFNFAFQPIVEGHQGKVIGYEALVRGVAGQPAESVLATIRPENRERFDQAMRQRAIREASRLGIHKPLHLNCTWLSPKNVAAAMIGMLNVASVCGFSRDHLVIELQNLERFGSLEALDDLRRRMKDFRVRVLVDKFGAGQADLSRLAVLRPDMLKLDRGLISEIHRGRGRQAVVSGIVATCRALGIKVIGLGVEDAAELHWLSSNGVGLFQGFYFGRPAVDRVPESKRVGRFTASSSIELSFAAAALA